MTTAPSLWIGGLGWPYDMLLAAALRAHGHTAEPLGPLDADAMNRGVAALPRGQCAPALFTTGALLRRAEQARASEGEAQRANAYLRLTSCGPCRYSLFGLGYERALRIAGLPNVALLDMNQSLHGLTDKFGEAAAPRVLDALLVADALAERLRRQRLGALSTDALETRAQLHATDLATQIEHGEDVIEALRALAASGTSDEAAAPAAPIVAVVGEPFSLHVDGPAQLNLPRVLARAGANTRMPPLALWLAYRLWCERQPRFGRSQPPDATHRANVEAREAALRARYAQIMAAAALPDHPLPDVDHLADLARPHLPPSWRAGYGHVEVGLALEAAKERGAHLVISVKSFGCLPSSAVTDAILPQALRGHAAFLALEVSGDGEAARESRLSLRLSAAHRVAKRQAADQETARRRAAE